MEPPIDRAAVHYLDRHQMRRDRGIPTISVLAGPPTIALAAWQQSKAVQSRSCAVAGKPDVEPIVRQWADRLLTERDLFQDALTYLARHASQTPDELRHSLTLKTAHQRELFFNHTFGDTSLSGVEILCRLVLEAFARGGPIERTALIDALYASFTLCEQPWIALMTAVTKLIPANEAPGLLLVQPDFADETFEWINAASRSLIQIAALMPTLPIALAVTERSFEAFLNAGTDSRAKAALREGFVHLQAAKEAHSQYEPHATLDSKPRIKDDAMPRPTFDERTDKAARTPAQGTAGYVPRRSLYEDNAARSAAEMLLFARLHTLPETAGLFRQNDKFAALFGPRDEMEVDLLCRQHRIAIEIDGYYHFQNADAYRRDRRKDLLLQQLGFIVLRHLADDVLNHMDEVIDTILATISHQRGK